MILDLTLSTVTAVGESLSRSCRQTVPLSGRGEQREPRSAAAWSWAASEDARFDDDLGVAAKRPPSDPALNGLWGVLWTGVEAELGVRRLFADQVDELLEQEKQRRHGTDACAD